MKNYTIIDENNIKHTGSCISSILASIGCSNKIFEWSLECVIFKIEYKGKKKIFKHNFKNVKDYRNSQKKLNSFKYLKKKLKLFNLCLTARGSYV